MSPKPGTFSTVFRSSSWIRPASTTLSPSFKVSVVSAVRVPNLNCLIGGLSCNVI